MKKVLVAVLSAVLITAGAVFIFAQTRGDGSGFGKHGRHERGGHGLFLRGLGLTDEQKAQVKQIMEASRESNKSLHEQLKANHQKLAELTENGAFDEAQISAVANNQGTLHAQMIVERERVKSQIFALLTDEQKIKAAGIKAKMKERFKNRMEKTAPSDEE